jgi:hypothetical protein
MRREDIQQALEAACALSNHHEFVIAGSLSVLGLLKTPPKNMSYSIDIDFYPLRDPGRASDIAAVLGENSDFHERNGYYLDAVSPDLPVLPDGWQDRLVKVEMGQATAYFLDVHDTAVSKYARGAKNDYRWIEAGYEAKILDIDTIETRVRFSTTYFDGNDKRKTTNGLLMHRTSMQPDGSLEKGLLDFLHINLPAQKLREVDHDRGRYVGNVLWADDYYAVQSLGRGDIVIHTIRDWLERPEQGDDATVHYHDGVPAVDIELPARDRGPSLGR